MNLKTRIWIIVSASLLGLLIVSALGLYSLRQSMLDERRAQIGQLLDFADSQLKYFHEQESSGKLSHEQAQTQAKQALGAQRSGSGVYYFVRSADDTMIVHAITSRVGKVDDGGKLPDGRTLVQQYRDGLAKSSNNRYLVTAQSPRTNREGTFAKLNGITKFEPWSWTYGIGFFVDDIDELFKQRALIFTGVVGVIIIILAGFALRMSRSILGQLGGEPQYAAEIAQGIANGDLSRHAGKDPRSRQRGPRTKPGQQQHCRQC